MKVRSYTDADLEAVAAVFTSSVHVLAAAAYDETQRAAWAPQPPDLYYWRKRLRLLRTLVAVQGAEVAGFVSYEPNGHIALLYVAPSYARRGVASLLYGHAENALLSTGVAEFFTEASLVAKPAFERFGFVVTEEQEVSLGGSSFRRYAMRKQLVAAQLRSSPWRAARGSSRDLASDGKETARMTTTSTQWQLARDAAERYERILVPTILGPAARALVELAGLQAGEAALDVGCGTGAAARCAAQRVGPTGRVVAVDVNAGMIEVARSLPPVEGATIEWVAKSAYELPFADGEFTVVLCAQTLQFLDDRPRALAEMYRVLKSGGRVAVSLWCDIWESPYFDALVQAVTRHLGAEMAMGLRAAFGLSDLETIRALVQGAGYNGLRTTAKQLDLPLPVLSDFIPRHVSATPMAAGFNAASPEKQQAVVEEASEKLAAYDFDNRVCVPFRTYLVEAVK